jgi:Delta14-sterol reductase
MDAARKPGAFSFCGSVLLLAGLPPLVYYVWICLAYNSGALIVPRSADEWLSLPRWVPAPTPTAVLIWVGWLAFQALLQLCAPGKVAVGTPLPDGTHLRYRMNGWFTWWFTWACLVGGVWAGWVQPTILADQLGPLLTVGNLVAFSLSLYLYWHGRRRSPGEQTSGNVLYDYFIGTSLNPRHGPFDFKFFCESRPGLIGWVAINLSLAAKQYELHGTISTPMILVNAFQFLYVADYFFHEEAILNTWDIKHEKFGWMLCWGDLVWVPFTYTIQAQYLVRHPHELPLWATAGIVTLHMAGYSLFRAANVQKHRFRRDPQAAVWGKPPEYIRTAQGGLLLVSGWWGIARHLNYLGDLMMGLAWCLPCGLAHPLPYFYIAYFAILLVHRERRDYAMCLAKYGKDWETYCRRVPWRIIPRVY